MAIAGSGGWTPSCRVVVKNGNLVAVGIVCNKPADGVYSDTDRSARGKLADAVEQLANGAEYIQCDMTNGQFMHLIALWRKRTAPV